MRHENVLTMRFVGCNDLHWARSTHLGDNARNLITLVIEGTHNMLYLLLHGGTLLANYTPEDEH